MAGLFNAGEYEAAPTMFDATPYRQPATPAAPADRPTAPRCAACGAEVGPDGARCGRCTDAGHEAPELGPFTEDLELADEDAGPAILAMRYGTVPATPMLAAGERLIVARYRGDCISCGSPIVVGAEVIHTGRRNTRHVGCPPVAPATGSRSTRTRSRAPRSTMTGRCIDAPCCGCC